MADDPDFLRLYKEERGSRKGDRAQLKEMETMMTKKNSPESDANTSLNFKETELTLGLPGESRTTTPENGGGKICSKRGFSETVDLKLGRKDDDNNESGTSISRSGKVTAASSKAQVVGWPPVRSFRKNVLKSSSSSSSSSCTYVKVAVDGAPYLRKVDLELYSGYTELLRGLTEMFTCFTIRQQLNESKLIDPVNGTEYVSTYEDKDGDWMLVGDVPWKMFVESCKRLRLMKSSEAIGLAAPGTPPKSISTR